MTRYTLTLLEEHRAAVQRIVLQDDCERGALLLCGRSNHVDPWTGVVEERFLSRRVIDVEDSAYRERSGSHMTWSTTPFYNLLKEAEPRDFAVAIIHSHPRGPLAFSSRDDVADGEMFEIAFNRLESLRPHLSMVMDGEGKLVARAYDSSLKAHDLDLIRVIGDRWRIVYAGAENAVEDEEFDRQVRTFGARGTQDLRHLRIGIAGCGGTGSAVASLLVRVGVRRLVLFDNDRVDESNLNRLHFSTRADANLGELKVDVVGQGIAEIGLPTSVVKVKEPVDSKECRDAVRACDVVFGCTDDHLGRNLLNRVAHFYLIPVIDLGLLIEPREMGGYDAFDGRVTVVQPGYPCQVCRGLIEGQHLLAEGLRRNDPILYQQRRLAGYVPSAAEPSPVVVTFTTELAALAVNELFQRLTGFRGEYGSCAERVRRFDEVKDSDTVPAGQSRPGCKLCNLRRFDGRGDMSPFLDQS